MGGVEVITAGDDPQKIVSWVTQFYRGYRIDSMRHFSSGPAMMKDIRLIELQDGRIGVFTRPQGEKGGRGMIGFTIIDSLEELNEQTFLEAEIFQDQFVREEWGGANEAHLLKNGHVGVLGHMACFDRLGKSITTPWFSRLIPARLKLHQSKLLLPGVIFQSVPANARIFRTSSLAADWYGVSRAGRYCQWASAMPKHTELNFPTLFWSMSNKRVRID